MTDDGRASVCRSAELQFGTRRARCLKTGAPTSGPACIPTAMPANHAKENAGGCRVGDRRSRRESSQANWVGDRRAVPARWERRAPLGFGKACVILPGNARRSGNEKAVSLFDLIRRTLCRGEWDKLGPMGMRYSVNDLVRNRPGVCRLGAPRRLRGSVRPTIGFRSTVFGRLYLCGRHSGLNSRTNPRAVSR
jgi:hypothetical protein